jgi:hypothetical protein
MLKRVLIVFVEFLADCNCVCEHHGEIAFKGFGIVFGNLIVFSVTSFQSCKRALCKKRLLSTSWKAYEVLLGRIRVADKNANVVISKPEHRLAVPLEAEEFYVLGCFLGWHQDALTTFALHGYRVASLLVVSLVCR